MAAVIGCQDVDFLVYASSITQRICKYGSPCTCGSEYGFFSTSCIRLLIFCVRGGNGVPVAWGGATIDALIDAAGGGLKSYGRAISPGRATSLVRKLPVASAHHRPSKSGHCTL